MQDKAVHSSIKILSSVGEDSDNNKVILVLAETIEESNKVTNDMYNELSNIKKSVEKIEVRKDINEALEKSNDMLLLKLNQQTDKTKDNILATTKEIVNNALKYLLIKVVGIAASISFLLGLVFYYLNQSQMGLLEASIKLIMTKLGIK
jgi:ElaB/YqjD/DUF883 family membrane-anchored ribosome-binding protein